MLSRLRSPHFLRRPFTSLSPLPPTIKELLGKPPPEENGYSVPTTVHGWIKSVRRQKKVSFAVINDGTTLKGLQAVFLHLDGEQSPVLKGLVAGASVRLTGKLTESPGKGQARELQVADVQILGECDAEVRENTNLSLVYSILLFRYTLFRRKIIQLNSSGRISIFDHEQPASGPCYVFEINCLMV